MIQVTKWNQTHVKSKAIPNPHKMAAITKIHILRHILTHTLHIYNITHLVFTMTSKADHK